MGTLSVCDPEKTVSLGCEEEDIGGNNPEEETLPRLSRNKAVGKTGPEERGSLGQGEGRALYYGVPANIGEKKVPCSAKGT